MPETLETTITINTRPTEQLCQLLSLNGIPSKLQNNITADEWSEVVKSAVWFGLGPVFYKHLKQQGDFDQIPREDQRVLKNIYLSASAKALLRQIELMRIVKAFQKAGIHFIALKGAHLAETVYCEPALRMMSDLDLMVPKEDLGRAADSLTSLGYSASKKYWIDVETSISHQLPYFDKPGCHPIEIHWTILLPRLPYKVDLSGLWERAQPFSIGELELWGLSCEDFLLHIAVHAATQHHLAGGLRLVYDLAAALDYYQEKIDWGLMKERSQRWNIRSPLFLMLMLSQLIFAAPIPESFLKEIKPAKYSPEWIAAAKDLLFLSREGYTAFSSNLATFLNTPRLDQKIRLFLHQVFLPRDEMAAVYPVHPKSARIYLYYPVRFGYLVNKHFSSIFKSIRGDSRVREKIRLVNRLHEREEYLYEQLKG